MKKKSIIIKEFNVYLIYFNIVILENMKIKINNYNINDLLNKIILEKCM